MIPEILREEARLNRELVARYQREGYVVVEGAALRAPFGCPTYCAVLRKNGPDEVLTMEGGRDCGLFPRRITQI